MPKTEIEVPAGMTAEQLVELVTNYEEKRVKSKAREKARKDARNTIIEKHRAEYDALVAANMPKG